MATYPDEVYPADATIEGLDGTGDSATGLTYIAKGVGPNSSPTYEVRYNRRLQRQNDILSVVNQGRVVDEGGLIFGVFPIVYYYQDTRTYFAGATGQSVADDSTVYVWLNSSNQLTTGASFPGDTKTFLPLAKITTANGDITSIEDERGAVLFHIPYTVV
ncbi:MAG: hypothetical protein KAV82_06520 [Phycisphaerae bacterium]|nr:hypothetical protein [Phycisphaerae bacterium]